MAEKKLEKLRKIVEEKKEGKKKEPSAYETIDMEEVERIVQRMKKKYSEEGVEFEEVGGKLSELRQIIAEGREAQLEVQTVEDLKAFKSPMVKNLGKFYLKLKKLTGPMTKLIEKLPQVKQLSFYLYSANMRYTAKQYVAISTAVAVIVFILALVFSGIFLVLTEFNLILKILIPILIGLIGAGFTLVISFLIPRRRAQSRGDDISRELPFALRHMATELRAGIGLYRTLQTIATADYGTLSEEFARTINEIEEGVDTQLALRHFALRTQSRALRNALIHVIRALKTGGNLSEVMSDIAEDVSFSLRTKIKDFAEKMNFFAAIYIYMAIVVPVFIAILGGVKNTPLSSVQGGFFSTIPLDLNTLAIFYLVVMPVLLLYMIIFISLAQPKV